MTPRRRKLLQAFTLIEALLAAVILAMSISAIVMPFTVGMACESADGRRTLAVNLAQEMMEEILTKPFLDPAGVMTLGPESGETRTTFNCIDDYNGFVEGDGQIRGFDGQLVTADAARGMTRRVTCAYVYVNGQDQFQVASFIRVTVEVQWKNQSLVVLSRLVFGGH